ncbi:hypothetical protein C8R46DRAFT_1274308 [Mycena filopes]|nr:hypothetical protein C8R46DRAFT_1274308 [Mycena filopes]
MSVQELEARLDDIEADIEAQEERLNQLKRNKCAVRRELNSLRDPVARLPPEIASEIFIQCLPDRRKPAAGEAPMLLLQVCNGWSDIAISTAALWSTIQITLPRVEILRLWLERARSQALSITLIRALDDAVATALQENGARLKYLKICEEEHLGSLAFVDGGRNVFSIDEVMGLLKLAPNLVECIFDDVVFFPLDALEAPLVLNLTCLHFGITFNAGWRHNELLDYLSLPALTALFISLNTSDAAAFSGFLKRSSPPLQKLLLDNDRELLFIDLDICLRIVPTLTHLEIYLGDTVFGDQLLTALADAPSDFIPNLRDLKMCSLLSEFPDDSLLRALSARCNRLTSFELVTLDAPLGADVYDALYRLSADGMRISMTDGFQEIFSSTSVLPAPV